jgi:hypothetical protein
MKVWVGSYLTRNLEVHKLINLVVLPGLEWEVDLVLFIITIDEVLDDRVGLP